MCSPRVKECSREIIRIETNRIETDQTRPEMDNISEDVDSVVGHRLSYDKTDERDGCRECVGTPFVRSLFPFLGQFPRALFNSRLHAELSRMLPLLFASRCPCVSCSVLSRSIESRLVFSRSFVLFQINSFRFVCCDSCSLCLPHENQNHATQRITIQHGKQSDALLRLLPCRAAFPRHQSEASVANAIKLDGSEFKGRNLKVTAKRVNVAGYHYQQAASGAGGEDGGRGGRGGGRGFYRGGRGGRGRGGYHGRGGYRGGYRGGRGGRGRGYHHPYY
mmetsp:Transcript_801/g.1976  ORF Transcript_801/g.1976 Transcript_801/m.1976 type:complete len:277 (+) Transcript_801:522-1352(+)